MIEDRLKNKLATPVAIFRGSAKANLESTANTMIGEQIVVEMPNSHWEGSEGYIPCGRALQKKPKKWNQSALSCNSAIGAEYSSLPDASLTLPEIATEVTDVS